MAARLIPRPVTLRRRLTIASAVAVAVAIALAATAAYFVVRDQLRAQVDSDLRDLAGQTSVGPPPAGQQADHGDVIRRRVLPAPLPPRAAGPGTSLRSPIGARHRRGLVLTLPAPPPGGVAGYTQLVTADGSVLRPPGNGPQLPVDRRTLAVARGRASDFFEDLTVDGSHLRVLTTQAGRGEALQVARSLDDVDSSLDRVALILTGIGLAGIALAALIGLMVTRAALRPVSRLSTTAEEVAETRDLSRRIEGEGGDEIGRLVRSFNSMLAALEESLAAQRQLVADASHELRTPLTSVRTNVEILARANGIAPEERARLLADVVAQLDELGVLVGDVVELARDGERDDDVEALRLDLLVSATIDRSRPAARFEADLRPTIVEGSPRRLERAVRNLLDNAVKWGPAGEPIEVSLADGVLSVRDHGPGIPEAELTRVFDRFHRAPAARGTPGSGLGLAIVRQVAEAGGGWAVAENAGGGGALLRVRFGPASVPARGS
jgi:two-component system, OmpR family, sensor histidine kinase MprB